LPNIFPILPGLRNLTQSVLPLPDGTPRTGPVEPPAPPTDALARIDLPYYRLPVRPWYPPVGVGTGGSPGGQQAPPFGPPPIYVMPPVWVGAPHRPWPPYGGVPLPPATLDWGYLWGREPWWFRGPVLKPDMPSIQPVPGSAPPPQPEPVKITPPPQTTPPPPKQEPPKPQPTPAELDPHKLRSIWFPHAQRDWEPGGGW
jgi:hypothetical protein